MQKLSIKKLSLLGIVLMGASALTAAILPSKKDDKSEAKAANGILQNSANNGQTCITASNGNCNDTTSVAAADSFTSGASGTSGDTGQGAGGDLNTTGQDAV